MLAAAVKGDNNARVATTETVEMCMFLVRLYGVQQELSGRQVCLVLCHSDQPPGLGCSTTASGPAIVAHSEAT